MRQMLEQERCRIENISHAVEDDDNVEPWRECGHEVNRVLSRITEEYGEILDVDVELIVKKVNWCIKDDKQVDDEVDAKVIKENSAPKAWSWENDEGDNVADSADCRYDWIKND